MSEPIRWVRDDRALSDLLGRIEGGPVAIDSEADSLHRYPEWVCLVQVTVDGDDYLVDPLAGVDLGALGPMLGDPGLRKILHGADYDVRILQRDFGLRIRGIFDTMIAARLVGETSFGLAAQLERHVGVRLDKRFQTADWSRRPLSPEMEAYAAMDTRHLVELAQILESELSRLGRVDWAEEEFRRLEAIEWSENEDPERFRRVKGSGPLSPRELAVLRELYAAREELARAKNRPPFKIVRDDALLRLVQARPGTPAELAAVAGVPRHWARSNESTRMLEAVARGLSAPDSDLPERRKARRSRPEPEMEARMRVVCKIRDREARQLGLEPSLLASRGQIEAALAAMGRGEDPEQGGGLRRWQMSHLRSAFDEAMA